MERTNAKKKVLFICTHNAARSQMAEGFVRAVYDDHYEAYSAGIEPTRVHPCAIRVMQDVGIDISSYRSKSLEEFDGQEFDYVATLCDDAQEACPIFLGGHIYLHHAFDNPSKAKEALTDADGCSPFIALRDQLKAWIEETFDTSE